MSGADEADPNEADPTKLIVRSLIVIVGEGLGTQGKLA